MSKRDMEGVLECKNVNELDYASQEIINFAGSLKIWAFEGEMGAGKTTLIKAVAKRLHSQDHVTSPTFSLVNEYKVPDGFIYHFDFYRISSEKEAFDIGCEEYFYSGEFCFIEWPSKIESLLPAPRLNVSIISGEEGHRQIRLTKIIE